MPLFNLSCVYTSASYESFEQLVLLNRDYTITSRSCDFEILDTLGDNLLYLISFNKVSGGQTYLLGNVVKDANGYEAKRLIIKKSNLAEKSFSINDFKNISQDTIDLNMEIKK